MDTEGSTDRILTDAEMAALQFDFAAATDMPPGTRAVTEGWIDYFESLAGRAISALRAERDKRGGGVYWTIPLTQVDPELLRLLLGEDYTMRVWASAARSAIAEERWRGTR